MLPRPTAEPMAAKMNADRETKTSLWGDDLIDMMSFPDRPRSLATELRPCRIDREAARTDVRTDILQRPSLRSSLLASTLPLSLCAVCGESRDVHNSLISYARKAGFRPGPVG